MSRVICLTIGLFLFSACASYEKIDRGLVHLPSMDVRAENAFGQPSPKSGLRNFSGTSGAGSCSVCAH